MLAWRPHQAHDYDRRSLAHPRRRSEPDQPITFACLPCGSISIRGVGALTPEEAKEAWTSFCMFDVDGDGAVSREDFGEAMARHGLPKVASHARAITLDAMYANVDTCNTGSVTFRAFAAMRVRKKVKDAAFVVGVEAGLRHQPSETSGLEALAQAFGTGASFARQRSSSLPARITEAENEDEDENEEVTPSVEEVTPSIDEPEVVVGIAVNTPAVATVNTLDAAVDTPHVLGVAVDPLALGDERPRHVRRRATRHDERRRERRQERRHNEESPQSVLVPVQERSRRDVLPIVLPQPEWSRRDVLPPDADDDNSHTPPAFARPPSTRAAGSAASPELSTSHAASMARLRRSRIDERANRRRDRLSREPLLSLSSTALALTERAWTTAEAEDEAARLETMEPRSSSVPTWARL